MTNGKNKNVIILVLVSVIFLIMAIEIFFLVRQNRTLRGEIAGLTHPLPESIEIGTSAPQFVLTDLHGNSVSPSDYEGTNLLLIFFSTECPACLMDIPNWKRLAALESDTLHVLGICGAELEETKDFVDSYALDFRIAMDPEKKAREIYRCGTVPQKILIDRGGKVVFVEAGAIRHNETGKMEQHLRNLLK